MTDSTENQTLDNDQLDATELGATVEQVEEVEQVEQTEEEILRDAQAAQMARELAGEDEEDFDPSQAANLTPEQEAQMLKGTQDILQTQEGAEMAAIGGIDWYEEILQEHGHERFTISDKKKARGAKRLTPVIQKYAPEMLGLFGQYKNEVMAAIFVGSMAYGSVKQIKALKAEDLAEDKRLHPEKYATQKPDVAQPKTADKAA